MSLAQAIKNNEKVKKHLRRIKISEAYKIDIEKFKNEIMTIQKNRAILKLKNFGTKEKEKLIKINAQEQVDRTRLVSIYIEVKNIVDFLETQKNIVKGFVENNFRTELKDIKTIKEKDLLIDYCFTSTITRIDACKNVLELCNLVIKDIDQGSYTLQRILNIETGGKFFEKETRL